MPYKFETDKINYNKVPGLDGRIKLNEEQKAEIKMLYEQGDTCGSIAKEYDIDRGTVKAIVNPEWYKEKLERARLKAPRKMYYNRVKNSEAIKKYRQKKKRLLYNKES